MLVVNTGRLALIAGAGTILRRSEPATPLLVGALVAKRPGTVAWDWPAALLPRGAARTGGSR